MCKLTRLTLLCGFIVFFSPSSAQRKGRIDFNNNWKFKLDSVGSYKQPSIDDRLWRSLNLPHDWSIELPFDSTSPTGNGGGALRGGVGWYRKTFSMPATEKDKSVFIEFDGVYRNSEVWINDHYLGKRPNGYISFEYELTPYIKFGNEKNVIAVKVDNLRQPNSRWYSGSGIYRNVWLTTVDRLHIPNWGTHVTTPQISGDLARVVLENKIENQYKDYKNYVVKSTLYDAGGKPITAAMNTPFNQQPKSIVGLYVEFQLRNPILWSIEHPYLYKIVSEVLVNGKAVDRYETLFGIRYFNFDREKGFSLNGNPVKLLGVCDHHDLGALGSAINKRAIERQLQILKTMGCNSIRTSHNPPAPELLELCDKMGFVVMDEAFDMWAKAKTKYDYSLDWN